MSLCHCLNTWFFLRDENFLNVNFTNISTTSIVTSSFDDRVHKAVFLLLFFVCICVEHFLPGAVWEAENSRHRLVWPRDAGEAPGDGTALCHEDPQQAEGQCGSEVTTDHLVLLCFCFAFFYHLSDWPDHRHWPFYCLSAKILAVQRRVCRCLSDWLHLQEVKSKHEPCRSAGDRLRSQSVASVLPSSDPKHVPPRKDHSTNRLHFGFFFLTLKCDGPVTLF